MSAPTNRFNPSNAFKTKSEAMDFTNIWGEGEIFAWYGSRRKKSEGSVALSQLQVRIDSAGAIPHRFVLATMREGTKIRFDRRPQAGKVATIISQSRKAWDDYCELDTEAARRVENTTQCEIQFNFPHGADLLLVLSAAFAIANDDEAKTCDYNLLSYNCFFFSWTVVMVVARHAIPFTIPSSSQVVGLLTPAIANLASSLTKKIVDALLSLVLDTITTFRITTGRSLNKGLSKRELMIWGLPTRTVRLLLKGCLKMRLTFGLEEHLERVVRTQLNERMEPLLKDVLSQIAANKNLEKQLWFDQLREAFGPSVRKELLKIVWATLLNALSAGYADMDANMDIQKLPDDIASNPKINILYRLKYRLLGENVAQFTRVWNEALHDALPAASRVLQPENANASAPNDNETEIDLHKRMFNGAFKNASKAALLAAQRVVDTIGHIPNNTGRDEMWKDVWEAWPNVWEDARGKAEKMVVDLITKTMSEIVDLVSMNVVVAVGDNTAQQVDAVAYQGRYLRRDNSVSSLPAFQKIIAKQVQLAGDPRKQAETHIKDIQNAMTRAWAKSRETYEPWDKIESRSRAT